MTAGDRGHHWRCHSNGRLTFPVPVLRMEWGGAATSIDGPLSLSDGASPRHQQTSSPTHHLVSYTIRPTFASIPYHSPLAP